MSTSKIKQVFRITVTDMQILGAIEVLSHYKSIYGLNTDVNKLLSDYQKKAIEIANDTATPAYITTGNKKESQYNLESLGADIPMPSGSIKPVKSNVTIQDKERDNKVADKMMELMSEGMDLDLAQSQAEAWYDMTLSTGTNTGTNDEIDSTIGSDSHPTDNDSVYNAFSTINNLSATDL